MKVKPATKPGEVVMEVGPTDSTLLSKAGLLCIQKILVPTDFSDISLKAMDYALAFAQQFNAQVIALHVVDIPIGMGEAAVALSETDFEQVQQQEAQRLASLAATKKRGDVQVETVSRTGSAPEQIIEAAKEKRVDLIILATHGRRGLTHFLLGSTTERVVRHAPCPVLVVREKEQEFLAQSR